MPGLIVGIIGLVNGLQVDSKLRAGDAVAAERHQKLAEQCGNVGLALGIVGAVLQVVFMIIGVALPLFFGL